MALAWRESRTARRRLLLYMSSISLGVGALVAIDSFASNTQRSVHEQARALLGGDIALSSRAAYPPATTAALDSMRREGVGVADVTSFVSMALLSRTSLTRLSQVEAVTPGYPFYGEILTRPAGVWAHLQEGRNALVDPSLLVSLNAQVGDSLSLGTARFLVIGTLLSVPGDVGVSSTIGPRVYIPDRFVKETGLLQFGSRSDHKTLLKLTPQLTSGRWVVRFTKRFAKDQVRWRTAANTEFNLTQAIDQLRDFLSIIGLVALLLGGIGVASGVNAFVMRKIDTVAILRCLGATSGQILVVYLVQAVVMGLLGAAFGAVIGIVLQLGLPFVLKDFLPVDVHVSLEPATLGTGMLVGAWVAFVFALKPLIALRNVSPLQTLRRESDAAALRGAKFDPMRVAVGVLVVLSVAALGIARAQTFEQGLGFAGAIGGTVLILYGAAALLSAAARRAVRPSWPFVLRQGVASLYRPGNQTRAVVLALGFGVFLMSTVYQVQQNLLRSVTVKLDASRANVVFFDVQDNEQAGLDSLIRANGYSVVQSTPIVPMKIVAINSLTGDALTRPESGPDGERRGRGSVRREYRATYRNSLMPSEVVKAGHFHAGGTPASRIPALSLDVDIAKNLRVTLGDTITWDVQGVRVVSQVTSLREVNWSRFEPNFFAVFETRALEKAPKQFVLLADVRGEGAVARLQRDAIVRFPNIASLDLSLIQATIGRVLDKVSTAIRFMAGLSLALGIPVLFSAVSATRRERLREGVLLKVLGATRKQVGRVMLAEYLLLGGLGSVAGGLLSIGGAWALMYYIFKQPFVPAFLPSLLVAGVMIGIAVAIGMLTGREVFRETPMAALREA